MFKTFYHSALTLVLLIGIFFTASAGAGATMRKTLTPRISVQEQYDDNIHLEPENEDSDWITLVSPGISLALDGRDTTMNFDYEAGFSFYQDDTDMNSTRHQGRAEWNQSLTRYLGLRVSDTFIRSEEPIVETEGEIEEIRRERSIYYRNTGEMSLSYEFGAEDQITAGYRHRYLDDTSESVEDSQGHEGFLSLDKWFAPQYGIGITSSYNRGQFERSDDFDQYQAGLTLNYRWQPSRRLYARYNFLYHDFEQPDAGGAEADDYRVHQGALGVSVALGPQTDFNIEGGYFLQDYLNGAEIEGGTFSGNLSTRMQRASLRIEGSGGYDQDYYSAENLGSSEYRQVSGSADYLITETLRAFTSASYRWEDFFETEDDRKDEVWRGSAGLSLSFWRYLTLSLEGTHSERDSDMDAIDFEDNRVMLRLTGAYPYVF
jgi:hypothetical protein